MTTVLDRPEKDCVCGHPKRWHNNNRDHGNDDCLEWGCKCRKFEEVAA